MPQNTDLGQLILQLDPYIGAMIPETVLKINGIDIYCRNPTPAAGAPTIAQIKYELDGPYAQDWNFRNQPQRIGMAVRICVRYEITRRQYILGRGLSAGRLRRRDGRLIAARDCPPSP